MGLQGTRMHNYNYSYLWVVPSYLVRCTRHNSLNAEHILHVFYTDIYRVMHIAVLHTHLQNLLYLDCPGTGVKVGVGAKILRFIHNTQKEDIHRCNSTLY